MNRQADSTAVGFVAGPALSESAWAQLKSFINDLATGRVKLFKGPLNYQDGKPFIKAGQIASDKQIWSMEQLLEGPKAVKAFQSANIEYMTCVEKAMADAEAAAAKGGSDDEKAAAQARYEQAVDTYNTAVSKEEQVAEQFNTEIREYKAANPK